MQIIRDKYIQRKLRIQTTYECLLLPSGIIIILIKLIVFNPKTISSRQKLSTFTSAKV